MGGPVSEVTRRQIVANAAAGERLVTPFHFVAQALATFLRRQVAWGVVREANIVRFDRLVESVEKARRAEADMPEVAIVPAGAQLVPHATSDAARVDSLWEVVIASDDDRWGLFHAPLLWAVLCMVVDWNAQETSPLGCDFVQRLEAAPSATSRGAGGAGVEFAEAGWTTIVSLRAVCMFDRRAMAAGAWVRR